MAFTKVVGPGIHTLAQLRTHNIHSAGIITATKFVGEMESGGGSSTFQNVTVSGNLTVQGDTTTLNTTLRNVELLRVAANTNTTAGIITQTGTGDILNLFDATTEVVTVKDGGFVGIGTVDPQRQLHVLGTTRPVEIGSTNATNIVKLYNSATGRATYNGVDIMASSTDGAKINAYGGYISLGTTATNGVDAVERLRIDTSGRHLIGDSTSRFYAAKLQVQGASDSNYILMHNTTAGDGNGARYSKFIYSGTQSGGETSDLAHINATHDGSADDQKGRLEFRINTGASNHSPTEALRINSSGRVVIGANIDPVAKLHIDGSGETPCLVLPDSTNNRYSVGFGNINVGGVGQRLDFYAGDSGNNSNNLTNAARRMSLTSQGRLGIGTDNPTDALDVYSTSDPCIRARSGLASVGAIVEICGGSDNDSQLVLSDGTTAKYNFYRDGSQADDLRIYDYGGSIDIIRYRHDSYLQFGVTASDEVRIDGSGNVRIMSSTQDSYPGFLANSNAINLTLGSTAGAEPRIYMFGSGNGQSTAKSISILTGSGVGNVKINAGITSVTSAIDGEIFRIQTSYGNSGSNQGSSLMGFDHFSVSQNPAILIGSEEEGTASYKGAFVIKVKDGAASDDDPVERFRIKSNGFVGIGTENPGHILDLYNSAGTDCLRLNVSTAAGGSGKQNAIRFSVDSDVKAHMGVAVDAGRLVSGSSANDFCLKTNQATDIILAPNGSDRLHIASSGKVGINTVSPQHTLDVKGNIRSYQTTPSLYLQTTANTAESAVIRFGDTGSFQRGSIQYDFAGNSHLRFKMGGAGNNVERVTIEGSTGRVGFSTSTSLTHTIHTFGNGNNAGARFENSHTTTTVSGNTASGAFPHNILLSNYQGSGHAVDRMASIGFDIPTTGSHANATIAFQAKNSSGNGDLQFWLEDDNTSRERLRITAEGNVGINESSPSSHLHIVSTSTTSDILRLEAKPVTAATGERSRIVFHVTQSNGQAARLAHIASWSQDGWGGQLAFNFKPANSTPNNTTVEAFRINQSGMAATSGRVVVDSYIQTGGYNETNESFANVVAMFSARDLSSATLVSGQTDTISGYARKRLSSDANGTFFFGPYGAFPAGDYTALFRLKVSSNSSSSACGYLDIIGNGITAEGRNRSPYTSQARIDLKPTDWTTSNRYQYFAIDFSKSNSAAHIETRWLNAQNNSIGIDLYIDHILILPRLSHGVEGVSGMHDYS